MTQELALAIDCDNGEAGFAAAVQTRAKNDPAVVAEMGMTSRGKRKAPPDVVVPTGVCSRERQRPGLALAGATSLDATAL